MKTFALCLTMLASSGCLLSRSLVLPDNTPLLDAPEVSAQWGVTELYVRSQPAATSGGDQRDYAQLEDQLETRLRRTLEAQTGLGHRKEEATYGVEVVVDVTESAGINGWLGLGASLESAVLLGGAGLGMAVAGPPGSLLGLLLATPVAVIVALTPPSYTELGELEATVVLRRKADGLVVATRHVRSNWHAEVNGYGRSDKLAKKSGASIPELEQRLLETLREVLREVPPGTAPLAVAETPAQAGAHASKRGVDRFAIGGWHPCKLNRPVDVAGREALELISDEDRKDGDHRARHRRVGEQAGSKGVGAQIERLADSEALRGVGHHLLGPDDHAVPVAGGVDDAHRIPLRVVDGFVVLHHHHGSTDPFEEE